MTARLLLARMPGPPEQSWPLLLRACGAYESFIRTHGGAAEPALVAEFLLLDRLFPRSVLHSLVTAEDCLAALNPGRSGWAWTTRPAARSASCAPGSSTPTPGS